MGHEQLIVGIGERPHLEAIVGPHDQTGDRPDAGQREHPRSEERATRRGPLRPRGPEHENKADGEQGRCRELRQLGASHDESRDEHTPRRRPLAEAPERVEGHQAQGSHSEALVGELAVGEHRWAEDIEAQGQQTSRIAVEPPGPDEDHEPQRDAEREKGGPGRHQNLGYGDAILIEKADPQAVVAVGRAGRARMVVEVHQL
jgi:hypothetical protein